MKQMVVALCLIGGPAMAETDMPAPLRLDPGAGAQVGAVYQAWLSPQQEGGEEEDTPGIIPSQFKSTEPSAPREDRPARGHGTLSFAKDYSRAWAHVAVADVDLAGVNMFHIHCGRPGQLGPIIIDFGLMGDLQTMLEDGALSVEITNADIEAAANHGHGLVAAFTAGCPIIAAVPMDKVKTIAGMAYIAAQGDLYFNLHTRAQTYFGDMRGQLEKVE